VEFRILQPVTGYRSEDATKESFLDSQEGRLLRLLLLEEGQPVSTGQLAAVLSLAGRPVQPRSVYSYVNRLKAHVPGIEVVKSGPGYTAQLSPTDSVDALAFRNGVRASGACDVDDVDDVAEEFQERYPYLLELQHTWTANPLQPFEDFEDEQLIELRLDFDNLYDQLRRALLFCELRSRRPNRMDKAVTRLETILRSDPRDEEAWALLVRAVASLPSRAHKLPKVLQRLEGAFPDGLPDCLAYVASKVQRRANDVLFAVDRATPRPQDRAELERLNEAIGVSPASALELAQSVLEPLQCIRQTQNRLWFSGILATKWVDRANTRLEFAKLLAKLDGAGGQVRFLMIDPGSDGYRRFNGKRWGAEDLRSVTCLQELQRAHSSFEVRMYDALPTFRIVLVDDTLASFSPYLVEAHADSAQEGWTAPHVVLDRNAPWPLALTFETVFNESWRCARPLPDTGPVERS
jgi:hypothetical protein